MHTAALLIAGAVVEQTSTPRLEVIDPATEDVLGTVPSAGPEEVAAAINAAQHALSTWSRTPPWQRAMVLRKIGMLIRERTEEMAVLLTMEVGKPLPESRIELTACAEYFEWYAEETRRISGSLSDGRLPGTRFELTHEPVGIVLALTAWNYPAVLAARKLAMALAAGCSIILRPAEEAPFCVFSLVQCCHDAGLPPGTVNLLFGSPEAVVEPLMATSAIRKVSFTGSTRVGQILIRQSAATVKRLTMELGGHAPFIVLKDADIARAAATATQARTRNAGQVCTSPSRFFVHEAVFAEFIERMATAMLALRLGNGLEEQTQMGPLATHRQRERAERLVANARDAGASVVCGGGRAPGFNRGYFFEPTILTDLAPDAAVLSEEPFAPIAAVVPVGDADEALALANATEFALAAYVFGRSAEELDHVTGRLEAGVIGVNTAVVALPEMPFGGSKQSGYGREGGQEELDDYLTAKFVHRSR